MRLIESAEAVAQLPLGSILRSHNGVAVLNQDGWIVSGYIYPRTHDDVEEYIGAYPIELIYDGAPDRDEPETVGDLAGRLDAAEKKLADVAKWRHDWLAPPKSESYPHNPSVHIRRLDDILNGTKDADK